MQVFNSPETCRQSLGPCVATIGKYDGMHLGHQHILDQLLALGAALDLPSVVVLSEPQPDEYFNPQGAAPRLNPFDDKVAFLQQYGISGVLRLEFDARVSQLSAETFVSDFLAAGLGIRGLVVGSDFRFGRQRLGDINTLQDLGGQHGFKLISVDARLLAEERVSSTLVREYLRDGDCGRVASLLGRPYTMSGEIIKGRQLGRQLGVPTANIQLKVSSLATTGVFAVKAECERHTYQGVANLGFKPTVSSIAEPSLEVHLLDVDKDLYGKFMQVEFLHKIRDEQKFVGLDALKARIAIDLEQARAYFAGI